MDLTAELARRGVSRRSFLRFCAVTAAVLALPPRYAHVIARGLQQAIRAPVIWLEGQDCAGNTEALLRAAKPTVAEVLLDTISLDYHETLMAAAGTASEKSLRDSLAQYAGQYLVVVEGSIPLADGGVYCTVGGRAFAEVVREAASRAAAVITVGSCAFDGGLPGAAGGVTGAVGVVSFLKDQGIGTPVINLSGCPMNPDNLTATIVQYLSMKSLPATDSLGRPLFAYGDSIHEHCEALPHFRKKEFVQEWGDAGHRAGWCLFQMGCKGPVTQANCPTLKFNAGTSWPVSSGHGCVGCTQPRFWDSMPLYRAGDPIALASPTPVEYRTPVPSTPPPATPGSSTPTPGANPPDGTTPGDGDGIGGTEIAIGAATLAAFGAAAGYGAYRFRRREQHVPEEGLLPGEEQEDQDASHRD